MTADGKILAEHDRYPSEAMRQGLLAWEKLPEAERRPRAVSGVPRVKGYTKAPDPPVGGIILKSHVRALERDEDGDLTWTGPVAVSAGTFDLPTDPQLDHVWLTEAEWKSLIPYEPMPGYVIRVRPQIANRIARFHLIDKALGCSAFFWEKATCEMKVVVTKVTDAAIEMELNGMAKVGKDGNFPVRLQGRLKVDRAKGEFTRFDMIAIGRDGSDLRTDEERAAANTYWYRISPRSKVVMAIAFELVDGAKPIDRVPPYALMFESDKHYNRPYFE